MRQGWRFRTFFCSSEKKLSMAALSAALATWPIKPTMSWRVRVRWNFRDRNCDPRSAWNDAAGHAGAVDAASRDGVVQRGDGEAGLHPGVDGVADDPVRVAVLDRAEVELALAGEGKLYLATVIDLYSRRLLACPIGEHPGRFLVHGRDQDRRRGARRPREDRGRDLLQRPWIDLHRRRFRSSVRVNEFPAAAARAHAWHRPRADRAAGSCRVLEQALAGGVDECVVASGQGGEADAGAVLSGGVQGRGGEAGDEEFFGGA